MSNYYPPPPPMNPPPPKQGSKVLMWSLIGCGSLIVIGAIMIFAGGYFLYNKAKDMGFDPELMEREPALAVGKIIAATNPDVELVSVDENKRLITLREKKTGKVLTINLEDAQAGRIVFSEEGKDEVTIEAKGDGDGGSLDIKTSEGNARFSTGSDVPMPDWIPEYPGAEITGNFTMQSDKADSGSFGFSTEDSIDEVVSFYEDALKDNGLKVSTSLQREGGRVTLGTVVGEAGDKKQSAYVTAQAEGSTTKVTLTYQINR